MVIVATKPVADVVKRLCVSSKAKITSCSKGRQEFTHSLYKAALSLSNAFAFSYFL